MTSEQLLKIITNKPGIDSVTLNLEIIKLTHPKEISWITVDKMIQSLVINKEIKHIIATSDSFGRSYYFPSNVSFHFS